jgi:hypothetical protein
MSDPSRWMKFLDALVRIIASATMQSAPCLTVGGVLAFAANLAGYSAPQVVEALLFGSLLPLWPLFVFYAPRRIVERAHKTHEIWLRSGIIDEHRRDSLNKTLLDWYQRQSPSPLNPPGKRPTPPRKP